MAVPSLTKIKVFAGNLWNGDHKRIMLSTDSALLKQISRPRCRINCYLDSCIFIGRCQEGFNTEKWSEATILQETGRASIL